MFFIAEATPNLQPIPPILEYETSVPGRGTPQKEDLNKNEEDIRADEEGFDPGFLERLNVGLTELREIHCPSCTDEEWEIIGKATKGFVLQVMYSEPSAQELKKLAQNGEQPKVANLENLQKDLEILKGNPAIFNTLSSLALSSWESYERFSNNMSLSLNHTNTDGYKFDPKIMDSPTRGIFIVLILGGNLNSHEVDNVFYSLVFAPGNSDGTANSIFGHVNEVKYGFVWSRDRFKWQRKTIKPYLQMLASEFGIDPYMQGNPQRHHTYGGPKRPDVQLGGKK